MKTKCIFLSLFILFCVYLPCTSVIAQGVMAEQINSDCVFLINNRPCDIAALDGSVYTSVNLNDQSKLKISSTQLIGGIYIKYAKPADEYIVTAANTTFQYGKNGFLHEYIDLSNNNVYDVEIDYSSANICSIEVFSIGQLPSYVQIWQPSYKDCDMLLFPTHSDDDTLYFGGVISTYTDKYKLQVAYITNHNNTLDRPHELLDGLWEMGICAYPVISDFPDKYSNSLKHAQKIYSAQDILEYEVEQIRRFKPEVVIGHDIDGEYGHGVHQLGAAMLMSAVEQCENEGFGEQSYKLYGTHTVLKTYLHLYSENKLSLDVDTPLAHLENKTARQAAKDAYSKHISQHKFTSLYISDTIKDFGLYKSNVGMDSGINNIFENIIYTPPLTPDISENIEQDSTNTVNVQDSEVKPQTKPLKVDTIYKVNTINAVDIIAVISSVVILICLVLLFRYLHKSKYSKD